MITPTIIEKLQWQAYLIFMCTNFAFVPLVYFCYPETSNLTLEEVDYLFVKDGNSGLKKFLRKAEPVQASLKDDVEKGAAAMHMEHVDQQGRGQSNTDTMNSKEVDMEAERGRKQRQT